MSEGGGKVAFVGLLAGLAAAWLPQLLGMFGGKKAASTSGASGAENPTSSEEPAKTTDLTSLSKEVAGAVKGTEVKLGSGTNNNLNLTGNPKQFGIVIPH